jgi:hypothetical protein
VLRRQSKRDARDRAGELPVGVRMDEVRVQDPWAGAREVRRHLSERDRIDVRPQPNVVERHAARAKARLRTPTPRARPRGA